MEQTQFPLDWFLLNLVSEYFGGHLSIKFKFHQNLTRIKGTLHEDRYSTFMIISLLFLLRIWNFSDKFAEKIKKAFYAKYFFRKSFRLWDNVGGDMVQEERPQITRHMRFAWYITKAINTHSEYVMFIVFTPHQCALHDIQGVTGGTDQTSGECSLC